MENEFDFADWLILALVTLALCAISALMLYLTG